MEASGVVVVDEVADAGASVLQKCEVLEPHALTACAALRANAAHLSISAPLRFFLEGAHEPLAEAVLLRCVRSNVLPRGARPAGSLRLAISGFASGSCVSP